MSTIDFRIGDKMGRFVILISAVLFFDCLIGQDLYVGAAQFPITPDSTVYIAGHSHNRKSAGVHDDLFAKAVVIDNGQDHITLLTIDCIGLLYPELLEIRKRVETKQPTIQTEKIILSSTHTHSGPDVVGLWGPDMMHSGVDDKYLDALVETAAMAVLSAWESRSKTIAKYGISTTGHQWVHNISEPSEVDRSLTILSFEDSEGRPIASLSNFACHPTFLDAVNDSISSDYPGGFYQSMDENRGGVNLFLQGSIGGWIQPEGEDKTFHQAFLRGDEIAKEALSALDSGDVLTGNDIEFISKKVMLPVENEGFKMLSQLGVVTRKFTDSVETEIAYFNVGNAHFATHPGETVPAMSHQTKSLMPNNGPKFILGLGNDALGYILKPYFFDANRQVPHSAYLCSVSLGPQTMDLIMKTLQELIAPN